MQAGIVLLSALLVLVRGQSTNFNRCLVTPAEVPLNVHIDGCVDPPCLFHQLEHAVIDVIFRAPRTISNMTTLATAIVTIINEMHIPYDLGDHARTCNFFTNTFCPILEGEIVMYRIKMFIELFFPAGTLATVEFRIVDNDRNKEVIWCVRQTVRIQRPRTLSIASEDNNNPLLVGN